MLSGELAEVTAQIPLRITSFCKRICMVDPLSNATGSTQAAEAWHRNYSAWRTFCFLKQVPELANANGPRGRQPAHMKTASTVSVLLVTCKLQTQPVKRAFMQGMNLQ